MSKYRPTHVMVGTLVNCQKCKGTGRIEHGFMRMADGKAICDACEGRNINEVAMSLEEFAKLFAWGTVHSTDLAQPPKHVIVVAEPESVADE